MPSLDSCFETLKTLLREESVLRHRGDDPVFYLVFPPERTLQVKRKIDAWAVQLKLAGYEVTVCSAARIMNDVLRAHPNRDLWLDVEAHDLDLSDAYDREQITHTLRDVLASDGAQQGAFEAHLQRTLATLKDRSSAQVLLLTDLEAIHPYFRIGALEQRLKGQFHVPTIVLYPGRRHGEFSLSFLGITTVDGNYRSTHVDCE
ncbi:MAG: BREX protein BrxB domain-containing protein [Bacteroidota bacterium]